MAFTKGPITYRKTPKDGAHDACELRTNYDVQHTAKLKGPMYVGMAYTEGDARLWSAAPDLYEACKLALAALVRVPGCDSELNDKLDEAIRKAEAQ